MPVFPLSFLNSFFWQGHRKPLFVFLIYGLLFVGREIFASIPPPWTFLTSKDRFLRLGFSFRLSRGFCCANDFIFWFVCLVIIGFNLLPSLDLQLVSVDTSFDLVDANAPALALSLSLSYLVLWTFRFTSTKWRDSMEIHKRIGQREIKFESQWQKKLKMKVRFSYRSCWKKVVGETTKFKRKENNGHLLQTMVWKTTKENV